MGDSYLLGCEREGIRKRKRRRDRDRKHSCAMIREEKREKGKRYCRGWGTVISLHSCSPRNTQGSTNVTIIWLI